MSKLIDRMASLTLIGSRFILAFLVGSHSTSGTADLDSDITNIPPQEYQTHTTGFLRGLRLPQPSDDLNQQESPTALEEKWATALDRARGRLLSNHLPDQVKAENFELWMDRLRDAVFYGQSVDADSPFYVGHPLDVFGLLGQSVNFRREHKNKKYPHFKNVSFSNLVVEVQNSEGAPVRHLHLGGRDLRFMYRDTGGTPDDNSFNASHVENSPAAYTFRISHQEEVLHVFKNNIQTLVGFGPYLVFFDPSRTSPDHGTISLSFIDLEAYEAALGRAALPVFRIPIKVGKEVALHPESVRLKLSPNGVQINEGSGKDQKVVSREVFDFLSQMQQATFNLTSSLVDPEFYSSTSRTLDGTMAAFDEALRHQGDSIKDQMERAGVTSELFVRLRRQMADELRARAQIGPITDTDGLRPGLDKVQSRLAEGALRDFDKSVLLPDLVESGMGNDHNATPTVDELNQRRLRLANEFHHKIDRDLEVRLRQAKQFGDLLSADKAFQDAMADHAKVIAHSRRLTNRLSLLWGRMIMPQPLGSKNILRALGFVAAGVTRKDSWSKESRLETCAIGTEGLKRLFANPGMRISSEVIVGASLCALYPAQAAQFFYHGLDLGRTLLDHFLGWGNNWLNITGTAWATSFSWLDPKVIWDTYFSEGNFSRLAVGVGALYGSLLAIVGTLHTLVNGTHYAKALAQGDWRTYREQGFSMLASLKQSFIDYVRQDKASYYKSLSTGEARRRGQALEIQFPGGRRFHGLFVNTKRNRHEWLETAKGDNQAVIVELHLPTNGTIQAELVPGAIEIDRPVFNLTLPGLNAGFFSRNLNVMNGNWEDILDPEVYEPGIRAIIKTPDGDLEGVLRHSELTPKQEEQLQKILGELETQEESWRKKMEAIERIPAIGALFRQGNGDIETMGAALSHFIFGYSSWTHSTKFFGKIWNPWFLFRNFLFRPRSWLTAMIYPNLFSRMVWNQGISTYFDGGKTPLHKMNWVKRVGRFVSQFPYYAGDAGLTELENFEREIVPAEIAIHRAAMEAAFQELIRMGASDPDVIALLARGGENHPALKKFGSLSRRLRTYFEYYFTELFNESLRVYLHKTIGLDLGFRLKDQELKEQAAAAQEANWKLDAQAAAALVQSVAEESQLRTRAKKVADQSVSGWMERQRLNHWKKVARALDPKINYTLNRYKTAEVQMNNPEAMARATRQYMVSFIVDKPIEFGFTLLFLSGINEGVLKPLHKEMFGPNSTFYLGTYAFWNYYFWGTAMSILSDVWLKIQMDSRIDALGGFDAVATPNEYKKGYLRYLKQQLSATDNKWWDNQKHNLKLIFVNMPAYFLTTLVTNLTTLGRFDLDSFVTTYKSALLPWGGIGLKLDQAFEKSTGYVLGAFPPELHADPRVQEYRNRKIGQLRLGWNIFYKTLWENPLGNLLTNWMTMPVPGLEPRAWLRQFYGGYLPTELLVNGPLNWVHDHSTGAVRKVAAGCAHFLTNDHTDAVKLRGLSD